MRGGGKIKELVVDEEVKCRMGGEEDRNRSKECVKQI
jgi:hypothetical protein